MGASVKNWKVNLAAAWVAQFLCIAGFTAAFPFTPFFIRELGVTGVDQVALWSGVITAAGSVSMAIISPVWGVLADRHGRKLMVERAAFAGAVIMASMALSGSVEQLLVLRILQGLFTGTIAAFAALVAAFSPSERLGFSMGAIQMAVYTGISVGPMIGGFVADQVGYRWTFAATGVFLFVAGLLVYFLVYERFERPPDETKDERSLRAMTSRITHSMPMLGAIIALGGVYLCGAIPQPVLPLFIESLLPSPELINTTTGLVYGANAAVSALSAVFIGHISDRIGPRTVLLACAGGSVLAYVGQSLSPSIGWLMAASAMVGMFAGGLLSANNAILARIAPRNAQGAVYGISNSVNSGGRAIGPMVGAAAVSAWGLRSAFRVSAVLFLLLAVWVAIVIPRQPRAE